MEVWVRVSDLSNHNDWMEVRSLFVGDKHTVEMAISPGRLFPAIMSWANNAASKNVRVSRGALQEYHFADCVPYLFSTLDDKTVRLALWYTLVTVSYDGAP